MTAPTLVIPSTPEELEDSLSDEATVSKLFAEKRFPEYIRNYVAGQLSAKGGELDRKIRESTQAALVDYLKANGQDPQRVNLADATVRRPLTRAERRTAPNPRAAGAALNGKFDDLADFMQVVYAVSPTTQGSVRDNQREKASLIRNYQEAVPSEGGFLLPEEFRAELFALALETAIVRPKAVVVPMSGPSLRFPTVDETTRVGSVFGGIVVQRVPEGGTITPTNANFGSVKLEASKQVAGANVSNELVNDASAFLAFMEASLPAAMVNAEDMDYMTANGAGAPLGMLNVNNPCIVTVAAESAQVAGTIVWQNIVKMYSRMLPTSLGTAEWIASPDTFSELATMALAVGTGGSAVWIINGVGEPVLTLLGRPVRMTEKTPAALGTQGDLSFVDWGMYLIGDRQSVTIDASPHALFMQDQTVFRAIARNDGRPWLLTPLTPANGSATLSPCVQLATR
jgi:HK97 family phage major capsid protein